MEDILGTILGTTDELNQQENKRIAIEEVEGEKKVEADTESDTDIETAPQEKTPLASETRTSKPRPKKANPRMVTLANVFKTQPTTMEGWLLGHKLFPSEFTYTPDGDLQVPAIHAGDISRVIPILSMQPASVEHTTEYFKTRATAAKEQESIYVKAKRDLKQLVLSYKQGTATIDDILEKNRDVAVQEHKLNTILKLPRGITYFSKAEKASITLNAADKGVLKDDVLLTKYTTFPLESMWMRTPRPEGVPFQPAPIRENEDQGATQEVKPKKTFTPQQIAIIRSRMAKN